MEIWIVYIYSPADEYGFLAEAIDTRFPER